MATLTTNITLNLDFAFTSTKLGKAGSFQPQFYTTDAYANGTAVDQANMVWWDATPRSLATVTNDDLDLAGTALKDGFNTDLSLTVLKGIYIWNKNTAVGDDLEIGVAATNPIPLFQTTAHTIGPDGKLFIDSPAAAGICSVTAGSADILRIRNTSANTITYEIAIWGID